MSNRRAMMFSLGQDAFIGLLDLYPSASQAYSFALLSSSYTGFCIRVQRTSDSATLDVGFVNEYLDTASLTAFVGSSTGNITIFYDQSGNSRNLTGINFRIINAGVLNVLGGFVYGEIISSTVTSFTAYSINAHSLFYTHNVKSVSNYGGIYTNIPTGGNGTMYTSENPSTWRSNRIAVLNNAERASNTRNARTTSKSLPTGTTVTNWNYDGSTTSSLKEDNNIQTIGGSASGWAGPEAKGLVGYNGFTVSQDVFEVIVYPTDKTTDSSAINTIIKNYYGI